MLMTIARPTQAQDVLQIARLLAEDAITLIRTPCELSEAFDGLETVRAVLESDMTLTPAEMSYFRCRLASCAQYVATEERGAAVYQLREMARRLARAK